MNKNKFEPIHPSDPRYGALAAVAARHNMTPEEWQKRAHLMEEAARERRGRERLMRQVPRYREDAA